MKHNDILIAGVGGQGIILASRLIATAAIENGLFVRTAETIGMAQRGGSVVSNIRIESENKSSIIPFASADTLIAFDQTEALRHFGHLKKDGCCIINKKDSIEPLKGLEKAIFIDGNAAGFGKALNTLMIGAAVAYGFIDFDLTDMEQVIKKLVNEKYWNLNIDALKYILLKV